MLWKVEEELVAIRRRKDWKGEAWKPRGVVGVRGTLQVRRESERLKNSSSAKERIVLLASPADLFSLYSQETLSSSCSSCSSPWRGVRVIQMVAFVA